MNGQSQSTDVRPNVALIIETSVVYGREILKGIARYLQSHERWSIFLDERELDAPPPEWILGWKGDGVICRSMTPDLAQELRERELPVVDLNDRYGDLGLPRISSDMRAIGRMAAKHLRHRGFETVAFCGFTHEVWSEERLDGVRTVVEPCGVFRSPWTGLREHAWQEERDLICDWLSGLPRPLGVVTCNDVRGHHVLDACRTLGLAVPEEVAVIGIDNADTFCALCDPPLSSVVPDAETIGYESAALLRQLMRRERPDRLVFQLPPVGVVTRQSTDSVAIGDPVVARAVRYIRENAHRPIQIEEVLAKTNLSRSTLERRFRVALGHSPHHEITQRRIKRAKSLLRDTSWSVTRVADEVGFDHPEYFMVQFKRETGQTPTQWRQATPGG